MVVRIVVGVCVAMCLLGTGTFGDTEAFGDTGLPLDAVLALNGDVLIDGDALADVEPVIVAGSYFDTDVTDSMQDRIDPNTVDSYFAGVGAIAVDGGMRGSCVLISRRHVLTAAHVFDMDHDGVGETLVSQLQIHFNVGGDSTHVYGVTSYAMHPDFTGFANPSINDDLAVVTLSEDVAVEVPAYPVLQRPVNHEEALTLVGYGRSGHGDSQIGYRPPIENLNIKRWGMNVVDLGFLDDEGSESIEAFVFDFDDPDGLINIVGGPSLGNDLETTFGPGDSGGPALVWEAGQYQVAGINTYTARFAGESYNVPYFGSAGGGTLVEPFLAWIDEATASNKLILDVGSSTAYLQPGQTITIDLNTEALDTPVVALQAFMAFDSSYFATMTGDVTIGFGDGVWSELIYSTWSDGGNMDVVVGVDLQVPAGTKADLTTARMTLKAEHEGTTQVVFRPDLDPDPYGLGTTLFSTVEGGSLLPRKINSRPIVIDGTDPAMGNLAAVQGQSGTDVDVLNCAATSLQGIVTISVDAADDLAGLAGVPEISVTGPESMTPLLVAVQGTRFFWNLQVFPTAMNGTYDLEIVATDKAGNSSSVEGQLCINKNQIYGLIELDRFAGVSREVVFVATDDTSILKTWTMNVSNFNGDSVGSYGLLEVPEGATGISAKTNWNLRRKLAIVPDGNGQVRADFTSDSMLLGGDVNGTNSVNVLDYAVLKRAWYTTDAGADFNGDGNVQLLDYDILRSNWFKHGDDE